MTVSRYHQPIYTRIHSIALAVAVAVCCLVLNACSDTPDPKKKGSGTSKASSTATKTDSSESGEDTSSTDASTDPAETGNSSGDNHVSSFQQADPVSDPQLKYSLHLRPKVGQSFSYRVIQRNVTTMDGMNVSDESVYNFTVKVTGVNSDKSIVMSMRYDSIRVRKSFPPVFDSTTGKSISSIAYDTRQKNTDPRLTGTQTFKAMIGQDVTVNVSDMGEIREISNVDPIISAIIGKQRDSLPPAALARVREGLKIQAFGSVVQQLFLVGMPTGDIGAGEQWSRSDSVPLLGMVSRMNVTYKLSEVKNVDDQPVGNVVIGMTTNFPKKKIDNAMVKATINKADVHGDGNLLVNLNTGFPSRKVSHIEGSLDLTGEAKTGEYKGKTGNLSQKISTSTVVELLGSE